MKIIFKYLLSLDGIQNIRMPKDAKMLCVQVQNHEMCLCVLVDPDSLPKETRHIRIFRTGHKLPDIKLDYIGTVQMLDGDLIWHVFEEEK